MIGAAIVLAQAAAQIAITASAPDAASACEAIELRVAVTAPGHVAPRVVAPPLTPFQLIRRTTQPAVTFSSGGDPTITVQHVYVVATDHPGTYTLPPFRAELGGRTVHARPLTIAVRAAPGPGVPTVVAEARIDTTRDVNFRAVAMPDTVYVGQQVQYEVAVFLKEAVRGKLRRNPTFFPPDMPGVLAYDVPTGRGEPPRRQVGGRCFDALVYQRAIFPLQAGRIVIPPAQLVYSLPQGPGLFARDATHELRTDSVVIVAIDPPADGRPEHDIGAVGTLAVGARVDTTRGRVGDPLLLTVRVAGDGNIKLLPRPQLAIPWGSVVADAERVQVDSASARIRGAKEFDWLVTPRQGGHLVVPPVEYPHFDPGTGSYVVARTDALALEIEGGALAVVDTAMTPRLALRPRYRGPLGRPLHAHPALWLLAAAAPLPALAGAARRRRRGPVAAATPTTRLAGLLLDPGVDAPAVRRAFVAALADRLRLPPAVFTHGGAMEKALRRSGVTRELAHDAERFLRELDGAAYGAAERASVFDARAAARTAGRLYAEVDAEALARWELGPALSLGITVVLVGVLATGALASPAADVLEFATAVQAYDTGEFVPAAAGFERLALREPRAPDAWANYGTAAWAAGDTAGAVVGWQRALRLEPQAEDVRARLASVRAGGSGGFADVPAVGVSSLAVSALALWLVAWGLAVRRRPDSLRTGLAVGAAGAALLLVALAVLADERLAARELVVVRHGGGLSASPAIGAGRDVRVDAGEVAKAGAREGGWSFVRLADGRAGWLPASEVVSIARAPLRGD